MSIRTFIALPVPDELAHPLGDEAARMAYQDKANAVRWVSEQNYHVTLAFLGDCGVSDIDLLANHIQTLNTLNSPITLHSNRLSPFPESSPKLIAAILDKTDSLVELQSDIVKTLRACQFMLEKRRFMPHITLGRYRHSRRSPVITPALMDLQAQANTLTIYESILTANGAEYEPLYEYDLGAV